MNNNILNLIDKVYDKATIDWNTYKEAILKYDKETILKNLYNNAIAGEWLYFFDGADTFNYYVQEFQNDNDAEKVLNMLLNLPNMIESLTDYVLRFDSMEFDQGSFGFKFEKFVEGYSGVKLL